VQPELGPNGELPFAVEPGMAVAQRGGFFATALRHEPRGATALLARLGSGDAAPQLVELGQLHGDVLPPRLAGDGRDLWVVLQEATGGGRELRVGRFVGSEIGIAPAWQHGPVQTNAESSGFDIASQNGGAMLAYDDWSPSANHGRILVASLAAIAADAPIEGRPVSAPGVDAEAPRLSPRPGGFWLAWLVNGSAGGTGRVYDPGDEQNERAAPGSAYGARWLSLASLDPSGKLVGEARRLTPRQERVIGYDLTTSPSGSAWVTWRQDAPTPGSSGGRVFMLELPADSAAPPRPVREDDVGAGEPTWLFANDEPTRWLTFPDAHDRTLLMKVSAARPTAPLRLGAELEGAAALTAVGDRVLFAEPRGRSIVLFSAACAVSEGDGSLSDAGVAPAPRRVPRPVLDAGAVRRR
jgi:hypothetical protein